MADTVERALHALMRAALAGDADSHRALLVALAGRLRVYFKVRLAQVQRDAVEAEDLVQETLMAIHTRRHTFDASQLLTPWVYAIARYKFLDHLRRTRASLRDVSVDDTGDLPAHADLEEVDSAIDLERLIGRLPRKTQVALRSVKIEGLTIREAAARSGMSESAIKVSIHRGLKTLAGLVGKGGRR